MFYILPFCYVCKSFTRTLVKTKYTDNGITRLLKQLKFCGLENEWIYPNIPVSVCCKCSKVLDYIYNFKKMFIATNKRVHQYVLKLNDSNAEFNRLSVVLNAKDAIVTSKESIKKSRKLRQYVPTNVSSKIRTVNVDSTEKNSNFKSFPNTNVGAIGTVTKGVKLCIDLTEQYTMSPSVPKTDVYKNSNNFEINIDAINNSRVNKKRENVINVHSDTRMTDETAQLIKLGNLKKCMQYELNRYTSPTLGNIENPSHTPSVIGTHHLISENYENNQLKSKESERTNLLQPVIEEVVAEFSVEQILINQEICTQNSIDNVSVDHNASNSLERIKSELPDSQPNTEMIFVKVERRDDFINEENIVQNSSNISAPIIVECKVEPNLVKQEDQLCTENNISNHHNIDISYLPESTNVTVVSSNDIEHEIAKNNDDNVQPNLVSVMKHKLINILKQSDSQIISNYEDTDGNSDSEMVNVAMVQIENVYPEHFITSIDQSVNNANTEGTVTNNTKKQFLYKCSFCKGNFQDPSVFAQHLLCCEFEKKLGKRKLYNAKEDIIVIDDECTMKCSDCENYFADFDSLATHASSNSCGPNRKIRKLHNDSFL